ncbi:MAG: CIC family chloride channel protein [Acidimicrobiales bacterium]
MRFSRSTRRLLLLVGLAAAVGFLAGGAAYLLVRMIAVFTNLALFGRLEWGEIPSLSDYDRSPRLIIAAVLGATVISMIARWSPIIRGHGIPEAMEAVLRRQSRVQPRTAVTKPLSAAIAIGTGAPFGAEGPIIVTGGAIGSLLGQVVAVTPSERKILLASGAAAGMTATFGAPLAAVLLAIELLLFELSLRSLIPLVVAASIAGGIHAALFGSGPLFEVPAHDYAGLDKLPLYALLGILSGLLAVVIASGLFASERLFRKLPLPIFWHPLIGALGFATIGMIVPRSLGVGYDVVDDVLAGRLAIGTLAAVVVAKTVSWWIALGSRTSGGTLAPVLLISAAFGGLIASIAADVAPGLGVSTGAYAVVAMAATFGAATRAPFTAMVFVFELTQDFDVVLPIMLATVLAALVATGLSEHSLYTETLARRGIRVGGELKADALRTTAVSDVMNRLVDTLPPETTVRQAEDQIAQRGRGAYPVVDNDDRCIGIVSRRDFLAETLDPEATLGEVAFRDVVTIAPTADLVEALQLMVDEDISHLPVIEKDRLVGICTRADILRARGHELLFERVETGWLAPVLQRGERLGPRYVVVANRTLIASELTDIIRSRAASADPPARFHIVVPLSGDGDLTGARDRLEERLALLGALDLPATGEIGDADPLITIENAVRREPTTEVIISTLPAGASRWLSSDLPGRIRRTVEVPLTVVEEPRSPN